MRILILGGTYEARLLAGKLAARLDVILSLAGRTEKPVEQGAPTRIGGFGGAEGLARYLRAHEIGLMIDATHPYAAQISINAAAAAQLAGVKLMALRRPGWRAEAGDSWISVSDGAGAVAALGDSPKRVFLALGRKDLTPFEAAPQHAYLIRSVDPVDPPLALPDARYILARGPFVEADETRLLNDIRIDVVVSKNSGGPASYAKLIAARKLGLDVIMIERPALPDVEAGDSIEAVEQMVHAFTRA